MKTKELSIIIVEYKSGEYVKRLVSSFSKREDLEVIVVDNSKDNIGYGAGCNKGAKKARGEYLLFLNPDVEIDEKSIENMLSKLKAEKSIGMVGPKFINPDGSTELSSTRFPSFFSSIIALSFINRLFPNNPVSRSYWMKDWDRETNREVDVLSGAALMMRKSDFKQVGGFDTRFFLYWEEFDLCKRIQNLGKTCLYVASAKVIHPRAVSMKNSELDTRKIFVQSRSKFYRKHFCILQSLFLDLFYLITEQWRIFVLVFISLFLRISKPNFVSFIGDQGRDYIEALGLMRTGQIPLLGIPSSVPRFSQGPMNIWFDAFSFFVFGKSVLAPVYASAIITTVTVLLFYVWIKKVTNRTVAFFSSLFLATSPFFVIQSRMPFYVFAVPMFTLIYLKALEKVRKNRPFSLFWAVLLFWMLFQWELATIPLILLILVVLLKEKIQVKKNAFQIILATILGLLPQLLFDLTHQCKHLCGFGAWIFYRIGSAFGLNQEHVMTLTKFGNVGKIISQQLSNITGANVIGLMIFLSIVLVGVFSQRKTSLKLPKLFYLNAIAMVLLLIAFFIHGAPSEAYFAPFIVLLPIQLAFSLKMIKWKRFFNVAILGVTIISIWNAYDLYVNNFLARDVSTLEGVSEWIVNDSMGGPIKLVSYDEPAVFATYLDNFRFLILINGGKLGDFGKTYVISADQNTFYYEVQ